MAERCRQGHADPARVRPGILNGQPERYRFDGKDRPWGDWDEEDEEPTF